MATLRKHRGKWQAIVRRKGHGSKRMTFTPLAGMVFSIAVPLTDFAITLPQQPVTPPAI